MRTLEKPRLNRRTHPRIRLSPMYTSVIVEPKGDSAALTGHAYDLSVSGVRIELDEPLAPGQHVSLRLELPGAEIAADANVMWVHNAEDDPGPRRMALKFGHFASPGDRDRLHEFMRYAVTAVAA